LADDLNSFI